MSRPGFVPDDCLDLRLDDLAHQVVGDRVADCREGHGACLSTEVGREQLIEALVALADADFHPARDERVAVRKAVDQRC